MEALKGQTTLFSEKQIVYSYLKPLLFQVFRDEVSFAEASMRCLTDSDHVNGGGALLTSIDNVAEDNFLTSLVLQEVDRKLTCSNSSFAYFMTSLNLVLSRNPPINIESAALY